MSRTIEQKVVEMRFDNSDFEKNVSSSIDSLNKLQESINKTSSGNAFAEIGKAANGLNFSGITASIQTVTEKFSVLEEIAIGALRNIGAKIEEHLVQALKHVTFDQIEAGFQRFSDLTESTQTILSAIATEDYGDINKLEYTEELLRKLAWFADETSYNFTDMTSNIAKFTAAGLDLDESTTAMMGIATWAANAGQNAQTASRAMYQLSQAMGMGSIKLIDWKSIEVANMATKEVKELLLQYAALSSDSILQVDKLGYYYNKETEDGVERIDVTSKNFRETLKEGWLTAEAFSTAMGEYASYSEALYKIIEKNEVNADGTTLIASDLIDMFDAAIEKSKETGESIEDIMMKDYQIDIMVEDANGSLVSAIDGVTELGIRAMKSAQQARTWQQVVDSVTDAASTRWSFIFQHIFGNVEEATELFTFMANSLYDVFVEPLNKLEGIFNIWKKLGGRDILFSVDKNNETLSAIQNIFLALETLLDAIHNGVSKVFPIFGESNEELAKRLVNAAEKFRSWTATLVLSEKEAEKLSGTIAKVLGVFKKFGQIFGAVFGAVKRVLGQLWDTFKEVFGSIDSVINRSKIRTSFEGIADSIIEIVGNIKLSEGALTSFKNILQNIQKVITVVSNAIWHLASSLVGSGIGDNFKSIGEAIGGKFMEVILWLPEKISDLVAKLVEFISTSEIIPKIGKWFGEAIQFVKGFFDAMIPGEGLAGKIKTIVDAIKGFIAALKETEIYKKAAEALGGFFEKIKGHFAEGNAYEKGVQVFNDLKTAAENLGDTIKNFGQKVWDGLKKAVDAIKTFLGIQEDAKEDSKKTGQDISKKGEGLGIGPVGNRETIGIEAFSNVGEIMNVTRSGMEETTKSGSEMSVTLKSLGTVLNGILDNISKYLPGIGIGVAGLALGKTFLDIANGFKNIGWGIEKIGSALKAFGKAQKIKSWGKAIGTVVAALGVLVLAVAGAALMLSKIDSEGRKGLSRAALVMTDFIWEVVKALLLLAGVSSIGVKLGPLSIGGGDLKGLALIMIGMAAIILVIAMAADKMIEAADKIGGADKLEKALKPLTQIIWHIAGALALVTLVGKADTSGLKGSSITFLTLAIAIKMLYKVAKEIGLLSNDQRTALNSGIEYLKRFLLMLGVFGLVIGLGGKYLKGAGVSLLIMVAAVAALILLAKKIGELNEIEMTQLLAGTAVVAVLGTLLVAIALLASNANESAFLKIASGMLVAVLAIAALSLVAFSLGAIPENVIEAGIWRVTRLSLLLAGLTAFLGSKFVDASKVQKVSASLLLIDVAIGLFSAIAIVLGSIPGPVMEQGIITIGAMSVFIGLLAAVFSSEKIDAGKVAGTSAALIVTDIAIGLLGAIILFVGSIPPDSLSRGEWAIGIMAVILAGLASLFSLDFIKPAKIATTSAALIAMSVAFAALVVVLTMMAEATKVYGWETLAADAAILAVFAAAIAAVASLLSPSVPVILAIAGAVVMLGAAAIEFALAAEIVVNTLVLIAEKASLLQEDLAAGIKAICNAIVEASPEITAAIGSLLADILLGIGQFFENLWIKLGELFPGLSEFFAKIGEFFTNAWESFIGFWERMWEAFRGIFETAFRYAKEFVSNIWNGIKEKWESVKNSIKEIFENPLKFFTETIPNAFNSAKEFFSQLWKGLSEKWQALKNGIKEIFENPLGFFTETIPNAFKEGMNFIGNLWDGIKQKWEAIKDWFKGIFKTAIQLIKSVFTGQDGENGESAYDLGVQLIEGVGEGIRKAWEWVKEKVRGIANSVLKFFGIEWEIKSPSRAMMRMGEYLMEGAAIGIENGESEATNAATNAADSVTNAMAEAMNNIDSMLSDNYNPTITPVMDLTQIQNGTYAMGNMLDSYDNYTMRAAVAANYNPYVYPNGSLKIDTGSKMADSIASLESKFDDMLDKLGRIRMVLDSGTLVGELVDPMDEALGRKAVYVGRGM